MFTTNYVLNHTKSSQKMSLAQSRCFFVVCGLLFCVCGCGYACACDFGCGCGHIYIGRIGQMGANPTNAVRKASF